MNQHVNDFNRTVQVYYQDLNSFKPISRAYERRLIRKYRRGNQEARNKLIEANLKFVFDVAKKYSGRGIPMQELISEGNMGLIRAIDKFDLSKNVKFITYAVWWIRQAILEALRRKKLISYVDLSIKTDNNTVIEQGLYDEENTIEETEEFEDLMHHVVPVRISIPEEKQSVLQRELSHDGKIIVPFHYAKKKKEKPQVRFDDKCRTAERLGLIHRFVNDEGMEIDLPSEIIEIYSYRNGIHIIAEQRKGISYELDLSKRAYRRMRPFVDQIKEKLNVDGKI